MISGYLDLIDDQLSGNLYWLVQTKAQMFSRHVSSKAIVKSPIVAVNIATYLNQILDSNTFGYYIDNNFF